MKSIIIAVTDSVMFWLPPLVGGVVDYLHQIASGKKTLSFIGLAVHMVAALFFGWLCGTIAAGLEYSVNLVYAAAGLGGYLGVRVADLIGILANRIK